MTIPAINSKELFHWWTHNTAGLLAPTILVCFFHARKQENDTQKIVGMVPGCYCIEVSRDTMEGEEQGEEMAAAEEYEEDQ